MLNRFLKTFSTLLLCTIFTSCIEVKMRIDLNKNGSGTAKTEFSIQREIITLTPKILADLKDKIRENNWKITSESENEEKYFVTAQKEFNDVSELNSEVAIYVFSTDELNKQKKIYTLEIKFVDDIQFIPYQIIVKMPGEIEYTNGMKISSNEAKWEFYSVQSGTKLYAQSSASIIPDFIIPAIALILSLSLILIITTKLIKKKN